MVAESWEPVKERILQRRNHRLGLDARFQVGLCSHCSKAPKPQTLRSALECFSVLQSASRVLGMLLIFRIFSQKVLSQISVLRESIRGMVLEQVCVTRRSYGR